MNIILELRWCEKIICHLKILKMSKKVKLAPKNILPKKVTGAEKNITPKKSKINLKKGFLAPKKYYQMRFIVGSIVHSFVLSKNFFCLKAFFVLS